MYMYMWTLIMMTTNLIIIDKTYYPKVQRCHYHDFISPVGLLYTTHLSPPSNFLFLPAMEGLLTMISCGSVRERGAMDTSAGDEARDMFLMAFIAPTAEFLPSLRGSCILLVSTRSSLTHSSNLLLSDKVIIIELIIIVNFIYTISLSQFK